MDSTDVRCNCSIFNTILLLLAGFSAQLEPAKYVSIGQLKFISFSQNYHNWRVLRSKYTKANIDTKEERPSGTSAIAWCVCFGLWSLWDVNTRMAHPMIGPMLSPWSRAPVLERWPRPGATWRLCVLAKRQSQWLGGCLRRGFPVRGWWESQTYWVA